MGLLADLLSDSSLAILFKAQDYADLYKSSLNTAHIIKAMFEIKGTTSFDLLRSTGIKTISLENLPVKKVDENEISNLIEKSAKVARDYEFSFVEPEHLLFTILKNKDFIGNKVLKFYRIDLPHLIERLSEWLYGVSILRSVTSKTKEGKMEKQAIAPNELNLPKISLDSFATNLNIKAEKELLDPVVSRDLEIDEIINTLLRRNKNNVLLVSDPGVGKTALAHGLAIRISKGQVPRNLKDKLVYELSISSLVAGTMYRGQFEERVKELLSEIKKRKNIILFIDEIHTLNGTGSTEGTLDLANILKPALTRQELSIIGATTFEEYEKHFSQDKALERRFQKIVLEEPDDSATYKMVKSISKRMESHHRIKISTQAIKRSVELSNLYIPNRFQPDKTIDLIDEACSKKHALLPESQQELDLETELKKVIHQKTKLISKGELNKALQTKRTEEKLMKQLAKLGKEVKHSLSVEDINQIVSIKTNIPLNIVKQDEFGKDSLKKVLQEKIFGQDEALNKVASAIARANLGFKKDHQPIASFLFVGPTGVGKSELAKQLAQSNFSQKNSLIKLDMSEYSQKHTVSQLIGSPKGYVGYEEGGSLTTQIRRNPHSVVLFDEIEKAHPDVFNILLQILEDGVLTDNHNQKAHFNHSIIILTSNLGSEKYNQNGLGFIIGSNNSYQSEVKKIVQNSIKPELISRLSDVIYFKPLDEKAISQIIKERLKDTKKHLKRKGIQIKISSKVVSQLIKFYKPQKGARSVDEIITTKIEDRLVDKLISSKNLKNFEIKTDQANIKISSL